jgi:elongation factor Ts
LERERAVLTEQAKTSGKPAEIIGKMVEGRLRKYYEDVVLLEQVYVIDGESRVKQVVEKAGKELGSPVKVAGYARLAVGEGIDKGAADAA